MDDRTIAATDPERNSALPIQDLPNLGPKSARVLRSVGIATVGDLERVGCVAAYVRAKHVWEGASLNLLWGMVAGLRGLHWTQLDPAEKAQLMAEVEAFRMDGNDGSFRRSGSRPRR